MARTTVYACFPLLLVGLSALLSGCMVAGDESDQEDSDQTENAAVVSSITEGEYVIRSALTGKCIDVSSSSTANGAKVQQWDCNGTNAQKFHLAPTSNGYFRIINVNSNKGLDIAGASTAPNARLQQWAYGGGANQQFKFVGRGNSQFSMHARHTDMAIDLSWESAANGTIIVQYPYAGWGNQRWTFDKVGTTTGGGTGTGTGVGAIVSRSVFETMFPNRSGFYTYDALVAAAATFPGLATTGDADTRKREVAAFLANVSHETGGLVYVEEIAKGPYCDTSWGPAGCGCAPGKQYFGRGPIQLSWNGPPCAPCALLVGSETVSRRRGSREVPAEGAEQLGHARGVGNAAGGRVGRVAVGELGNLPHGKLVDGSRSHEALQERDEVLAVGAVAHGPHEEAEEPRVDGALVRGGRARRRGP